jgi:hypothetical protein
VSVHSWRSRFQEIIGLDLRSLALYRISIALVILYDLADRAGDLSAHYTDAGILPTSSMLAFYGSKIYSSIHVIASGSVAAEAGVFVVHALAAVALLVGYRTRLRCVHP